MVFGTYMKATNHSDVEQLIGQNFAIGAISSRHHIAIALQNWQVMSRFLAHDSPGGDI